LKTSIFYIITVCLLFGINLSAFSSSDKTLLLNPTQSQVDSVLRVLDNAIAHKSEYQAYRTACVDSMIKTAAQKSGTQRIDAYKEAYSVCSHINGKKSMMILDEMSKLPEYKTDRNLRLWILDSRGYIYSVMGMFHRSYALLHKIKIDDYDRQARVHHYDAMYNILSWAGNAFCDKSSLLPSEIEKMNEYNDSLMSFHRDTVSLAFTEIVNDISKQGYDAALQKLVTLYPKVSGKNETYIFAHLCDVFEGKKDTLAMTYYFAKASINDILDGTTEYMCLPILVQHLFEQGDVDRAYHYLKCCLEDAYLYPSQFLISQTANIFPIIDKSYQQKKKDYEESKRNMIILSFCAALLLFLLVVLSVFLHHRQIMMKELKHANNKLVAANEELARALDIKNIFLRNMTHELHTPMNAIDGFAQILDADDSHADEATRKEMISAIRTSSHQLIMLIDNVIMLTEYEGTSVEKNTKKIKIGKIFDTLKQVVYNSKAGKVDVLFNNNIPVDFTLLSSDIHIVTILNNLIDSALKFTEEGHVTIKADLEDGNKVIFRVSDTGNGIPADKKDTIFNRLSKADDFAQGIGLGLPLCHTLTKMLDGDICVEKTDSNGTTISVTFPC